MNEAPYNPLDTKHLRASVAEALLERLPLPMSAISPFEGAGIYAIYYVGAFPPYQPIAAANQGDQWRWPIYIGKAVPPGARTGKTKAGSSPDRPLYARIMEHAESISLAENLDLADFYCRYLVVEQIWIPLGESLLIAKFSPIWNRMIDGFGNHDPGAGRYNGARPRWDVLHPGRRWALRCAERAEPPDLIASEVAAYLRTGSVPPIRPRMLLDD